MLNKDLNEPDVFKIFETFLAHNHYEKYAKYASSSKPQVTLTLKRINYYNMTLLAPFEVQKDKDIQDYNYEVDALEDEHVRREVHTTKIVVDEESDTPLKQEASDHSYNDNSGLNNQRTKKGRGRGKQKQSPIQNAKPVEEKVKYPSLKAKREAKKSFDFLNGDDHSDNNSELPYPSIPKYSPTLGQNTHAGSENKIKQSLTFSQIGARVNKDNDSDKEQNRYVLVSFS